MKKIELITLAVVARNEEAAFEQLISDFLEQDFPKQNTEIIFVDSDSTDSTKDIMINFATNFNSEYYAVKVLDNPNRTLPAGWNVLLTVYSGDALVRVDAHARIPSDFLSCVVGTLNEGHAICGGQRPCIVPESASDWEKTLLLAEESLFGSSIASYRGGQTEAREVESIFHGAYRREVFDTVGNYDERLARTEDNDIHYRMKQAGYKIWLDPRIKSEQLVRPSLRAMVKQKYSNGYWIGRTLFVQPKCLGLHHFVPGVFALFGVISTILLFFKRHALFKMQFGAYALVDGIISIDVVSQSSFKNCFCLLPLIFPLLHISYGMGTLHGVYDGLTEALAPVKNRGIVK